MNLNTPLIIGAGLSGLYLAYELKKRGISAQIVEARDRMGGRIYTQYQDSVAPLEMGATWLGKRHQALFALLDELGLKTFEQSLSSRAIYEPISTSPPQLVQLPPNEEPSFRIQGGTSQLIQRLSQNLAPGQIRLGEKVRSIQAQDSGWRVISSQQEYYCSSVISTLAPYLLLKNVTIEGALDDHLRKVMGQTHTWMGESIKVGLGYAQPFWREEGFSGTIFSNVGPIPEMYDHSNSEDNAFALKGFINGAYHSLSPEERKLRVLGQLEKYFGQQAHTYTHYEELVWREEENTFVEYEESLFPHQNNGHVLYQESTPAPGFFLAGSETSAQFPGYMEGALLSAQRVLKGLLPQLEV